MRRDGWGDDQLRDWAIKVDKVLAAEQTDAVASENHSSSSGAKRAVTRLFPRHMMQFMA